MDKKRAYIIAVGLTLVTGLFLLGYFTTYLAWEDLRPWRTYRATFARTIGLAKEDPVYVYGYVIGRVHQISLQGDHQLVEIQVDPSVRFYKDGVRLVIEPTDAFGDVGVFVEPGDPRSGYWEPDVPIRGSFRESMAASSDAQSPTALSESLKEFEAFTEALTKFDSSTVGRLVNDPDPGVALRDGFEQARSTTRNIRDALTSAASGDNAFLASDAVVTLRLAVGGTRDNIQGVREALASGNRGESGLLGRLAGDLDAATSVRDTIDRGAVLFRGFEHAEGGVTGQLSHGEEAAESVGAHLDDFQRWTDQARRGEGTVGGLFGPGTAPVARESLAGFAERLESMTTADPNLGAFFSASPEGRRAADDFASRVDEVLRDMRRALTRIRADQAPNTFPGALLSVF